MKRFLTLASLCLALSGALTASAQAAPELNASERAAQVLDCPTPNIPYGISRECAQALSIQETRDALHFADAAARNSNTPSVAGPIGPLDCPTPSVPYAISPACVQAISIQETRDALQFATAVD
jgi:hypothetical protein